MKYALIDMGSNSIRLTVYDLKKDSFQVLFKEKIMAGLAGYVEHGRLTQDGIDCACQNLSEFQQTVDVLEIPHLDVFATASLRNISNTSQAVEQIYQKTGIMVEILTGEMEAACGFFGAACDISAKNGLFIDIGGASTELAMFTGLQLQETISVPVGSLRLYRDCVKKILPGKESRQRIDKAICTAFEKDVLKGIQPRAHMVCVGGTARACLRLCNKLFGLPENNRIFTNQQLYGLGERLCKCDKDASDLILRYAPERIHTLIPGLMILQYLVERFQVEDITVSHYGVREGYIRQKIQPSMPEILS